MKLSQTNKKRKQLELSFFLIPTLSQQDGLAMTQDKINRTKPKSRNETHICNQTISISGAGCKGSRYFLSTQCQEVRLDPQTPNNSDFKINEDDCDSWHNKPLTRKLGVHLHYRARQSIRYNTERDIRETRPKWAHQARKPPLRP